MIILLQVICYLILLVVLFWGFQKSAVLVELVAGKKSSPTENKQALQSILSGLIIIPIALVLCFINNIFYFAACLGLYLLYSGSYRLKRLSKSKKNEAAVAKLTPLILVGLVGQLLMAGIMLGTANSKEIVERASETPEAKFEKAEGTQYVLKRGFARSGPSSNHDIVGVCPAGAEVKLLKKSSGFYYVKGEFHEGTEGKGQRKSGKFWIGGSLLSEKAPFHPKRRDSHWGGGSRNKTPPKSDTKKPKSGGSGSWPKFD